jgi:two-component system sensor histidine kinase YesM
MEVKRSLNIKFIIGFSVVITPLVAMLFYVTFHSIDVIRAQVSKSNHALLTMSTKQIDYNIEGINNYLIKIISYSPDINSIDLYKYGSPDYIYTKYSALTTLNSDVHLYPLVDSFFIYIKGENDLIETKKLNQGEEPTKRVQLVKDFVEKNERKDWDIVRFGNETLLIKVLSYNNNVFVGAYLKIDNILANENITESDEKNMITIVSEQGVPLTSNVALEKLNFIEQIMPLKVEWEYQSIKNNQDKNNYLVIGSPSKWAGLWLVTAIPEKKIMQSLMKLKRIVYIIPPLMIVIVAFYITFLHKILIKPMNYLLKGMERIADGDMNVQLPNNLKGEFSFITESFNYMVSQIHNLKISVYEEKIHTQEAEFKHLQLQINPHFFMNTLNIVYNLAVLKDYETIQKMSIHLASYFRFLMKTKKNFIYLADELNHTENYLEIQKLRFPDNLTFKIDTIPEDKQCLIPPVTIQTFVENSIIHGYEKKEEGFYIYIKVDHYENKSEQYFEVTIKDNGKGFSEDMLKQLNDGSYFNSDEENHIGLKNAINRLKIKYQDKANYVFENDEIGGAIVRLILPVDFKG